MQPYFLPYIGYFQLINAVDLFVIYDDVQFTKRGWINRNQISTHSGLFNFTIPCQSASEKTLIRDKKIASQYNRKKLLKTINTELEKCANSNDETRELASRIFLNEEENLFKYIYNSVLEVCNYMEIKSDKIVVSSSLGDFTNLRSQEKVMAICKTLGAGNYLNPISGKHLYNAETFMANGILLEFFEAEINKPELKFERIPLSVIHSISELTKKELKLLSTGGIFQNANCIESEGSND